MAFCRIRNTSAHLELVFVVAIIELATYSSLGCNLKKCISPLFNQVGYLRTNSHLQLQPGQDKAKQCDTDNNTVTHGVNNKQANNTNKSMTQ